MQNISPQTGQGRRGQGHKNAKSGGDRKKICGRSSRNLVNAGVSQTPKPAARSGESRRTPTRMTFTQCLLSGGRHPLCSQSLFARPLTWPPGSRPGRRAIRQVERRRAGVGGEQGCIPGAPADTPHPGFLPDHRQPSLISFFQPTNSWPPAE